MTDDKRFKKINSVEKDYEKASCTTSSIVSWLIKSIILVVLLLLFK